ncbi:hypothetical protein A374_03164 [Fictibacillus macauensis ZFHKF-1]|uniref:PglD N-terminal domain-containing protein n=1 Tax=Fictibacillus macauensis ZFHKF-1 TaxID=1196324 RepID=I8AL12_9BACL|nr:acetyltransferase [Fictibacillus macauensis]EIT86537.1 hypothetical protein A374_03164 [Fictibacillus macauensis ZFHKF-1]
MKIILIGKGGHSKVIKDMIDLQPSLEIVGYLDQKYPTASWQDGVFYGPMTAASSFTEDVKFVIAVGDNQIRKRIYIDLKMKENRFATIIHPTAIISPSAKIGYGTVIMASVVIQADAIIGAHTIINTAAVIEHDNVIANYAHISPQATLTGTVSIEEGVHIGAGAIVIPGIHIGAWSIIGAGATVIHNLPSLCTAVGVPARLLDNMEE